jgi:hypothetical protein
MSKRKAYAIQALDFFKKKGTIPSEDAFFIDKDCPVDYRRVRKTFGSYARMLANVEMLDQKLYKELQGSGKEAVAAKTAQILLAMQALQAAKAGNVVETPENEDNEQGI